MLSLTVTFHASVRCVDQFFDEVLKISVTRATWNNLVCILAGSSWVVSECDENAFLITPLVISLPTAKFTIPFFVGG